MRASRGALALVLAMAAIALAWQIGLRQGIERGAAAARAAAAVPDGDEIARRAAHEAALARLAGERDMARATVDALQAELGRADALVAAERAELELYRRIGDGSAASGLAIDTLERRRAGSAGEPPTLFLTLVQARGRDRVAGRVEVRSLEILGEGGSAEGGVPARVDDGGGGTGDGEGGGTGEGTARGGSGATSPPPRFGTAGAKVIAEATFDLRFFETLELSLAGADDGFPAAIDVRVIPEGARHPPFDRRFLRDDIREVD